MLISTHPEHTTQIYCACKESGLICVNAYVVYQWRYT